MRTRTAKWLWLATLPLLVVLVTATPAWAAEPVNLEFQAPEQVNIGDEVMVTAGLRNEKGIPVPGANIVLTSEASFLSAEGTIELDRAATDAQGIVNFLYQARTEGPITLNVYFSGDSRYGSAQDSTELTVLGSVQLYQQTAGVRLPGISVWLLVGVLGTVWSIYVTVMVLLALIARASPKAPLERRGTDA